MTRLGWSPEVFWAATPADLLCALEALAPRSAPDFPLRREELNALRRRFPDGQVDRPASPRR